jgi:hypothetical protein
MIAPTETHVRLSVGWCVLAYVLGFLTPVVIIWKGWM